MPATKRQAQEEAKTAPNPKTVKAQTVATTKTTANTKTAATAARSRSKSAPKSVDSRTAKTATATTTAPAKKAVKPANLKSTSAAKKVTAKSREPSADVEMQQQDDKILRGPQPKKPATAFCLFNTNYVLHQRKHAPDTKVTELFRQAGQKWAELDDAQKKPYLDQAVKEKELFEKRIAAWKEHGFFVFEDGTKSNDAVNLERVRKMSCDNMPKRPRSSFAYFAMDFKAPNGITKITDRAKLMADSWAKLSDEQRNTYNKLAENDRVRNQKQCESVYLNGYYLLEDGTKSSDLVNNKKTLRKRSATNRAQSEKVEAKRPKVTKSDVKPKAAAVAGAKQQVAEKKQKVDVKQQPVAAQKKTMTAKKASPTTTTVPVAVKNVAKNKKK